MIDNFMQVLKLIKEKRTNVVKNLIGIKVIYIKL